MHSWFFLFPCFFLWFCRIFYPVLTFLSNKFSFVDPYIYRDGIYCGRVWEELKLNLYFVLMLTMRIPFLSFIVHMTVTRLYTEEYFLNHMANEGIPEIQRSNLVSCVIQVCNSYGLISLQQNFMSQVIFFYGRTAIIHYFSRLRL